MTTGSMSCASMVRLPPDTSEPAVLEVSDRVVNEDLPGVTLVAYLVQRHTCFRETCCCLVSLLPNKPDTFLHRSQSQSHDIVSHRTCLVMESAVGLAVTSDGI